MVDKTRFEAVIALCESMAWAPDPQEVYQRMVDVSAAFFECDETHLHLLDFDGKNFARRAHHGEISTLQHSSGSAFSVNVGRSAMLVNSGNLIVMNDYENPDPQDVIPRSAADMGFKSAVSIPLSTPQGVLGMLTLVYRRTLPWREEDHAYLCDIGRVLGVMIQRIQMTKKDLELEILRERKRLSVEIHDNLSQMVSSLAMRSDTVQMCLEEGNYEAASAELDHLGEVSREITKVLRDEMLSLRAPAEFDGSFAESVADALARFEAQWGVRSKLVVHDDQIELSGHTALQLLRILNECLSNVLRHANAQSVTVDLRKRGPKVELSVHDDGCGFDPALVSPERLGIRIMQERALAARGSVRIESGKEGTTVHVDAVRG